jgi:hypothetical protein
MWTLRNAQGGHLVTGDPCSSEGALQISKKVLLPFGVSMHQILSLKHPLTTEIQLRITVTMQPANPMKNMTSTIFIAKTESLFAMILTAPISTESLKGYCRSSVFQAQRQPNCLRCPTLNQERS